MTGETKTNIGQDIEMKTMMMIMTMQETIDAERIGQNTETVAQKVILNTGIGRIDLNTETVIMMIMMKNLIIDIRNRNLSIVIMMMILTIIVIMIEIETIKAGLRIVKK